MSSPKARVKELVARVLADEELAREGREEQDPEELDRSEGPARAAPLPARHGRGEQRRGRR